MHNDFRHQLPCWWSDVPSSNRERSSKHVSYARSVRRIHIAHFWLGTCTEGEPSVNSSCIHFVVRKILVGFVENFHVLRSVVVCYFVENFAAGRLAAFDNSAVGTVVDNEVSHC